MADTEAPPPPPRWHYFVRFIDNDGVEQEHEGNLPFINQDSIMKYLARKYRPMARSGLFKELKVEEVTRPYSTPPEQTVCAAAVSSVLSTASRPPIVMNPQQMALTQPAAVTTPPKETFDKKACFIYRYMGPIETKDSKKHPFYEVVPHC